MWQTLILILCHILDSFNTPSFIPISFMSVRVAQCSFQPLISVMSVTVTSITVSLLLVLTLHFLLCVCSSGHLRAPNSVMSITEWCGLVWCDFCHILLFLAVTSVTISILQVLPYISQCSFQPLIAVMSITETLSHPWWFNKSRMWHCILSLPWLSVMSLTASGGRKQ